MDRFAQHQPDEGYSEEPLNPPPVSGELLSALSTLKDPRDLPAWIAANASLLPIHLKTRTASPVY